jgi:3-oxoadipate enol-lactonase
MQMIRLDDINVHFREDGDPGGRAIMFSNSLGTDLRLWDKLVALMPDGLRLIRYDMRGHGLSDAPPAPYSMGTLVSDAERLADYLGVRNCVFVGLSVGGLIAQGLAVKRPDIVAQMVLSNTAAKIGTRAMWDDRIASVKTGGIAALGDSIMERWFSARFLDGPERAGWQHLLERQPDEGYMGVSAAISHTDFMNTTADLTLPTLAIAGSEDGATPPDLVRETAALVPGSRFELLRGAGHLPCVEDPEGYARILCAFIAETADA